MSKTAGQGIAALSSPIGGATDNAGSRQATKVRQRPLADPSRAKLAVHILIGKQKKQYK
jgi:hypothetical protein